MVAGAGDAVGAPASLHRREVLAGQTVVVPQVRPEIVPVAGVEEVEVRLADVDVIDCGVGVELLVPLRDEQVLDTRAVPLLDVVLAHKLQDAEADVVAVAAAAGRVPKAARYSCRDMPSSEVADARAMRSQMTFCMCAMSLPW